MLRKRAFLWVIAAVLVGIGLAVLAWSASSPLSRTLVESIGVLFFGLAGSIVVVEGLVRAALERENERRARRPMRRLQKTTIASMLSVEKFVGNIYPHEERNVEVFRRIAEGRADLIQAFEPGGFTISKEMVRPIAASGRRWIDTGFREVQAAAQYLSVDESDSLSTLADEAEIYIVELTKLFDSVSDGELPAVEADSLVKFAIHSYSKWSQIDTLAQKVLSRHPD